MDGPLIDQMLMVALGIFLLAALVVTAMAIGFLWRIVVTEIRGRRWLEATAAGAMATFGTSALATLVLVLIREATRVS